MSLTSRLLGDSNRDPKPADVAKWLRPRPPSRQMRRRQLHRDGYFAVRARARRGWRPPVEDLGDATSVLSRMNPVGYVQAARAGRNRKGATR